MIEKRPSKPLQFRIKRQKVPKGTPGRTYIAHVRSRASRPAQKGTQRAQRENNRNNGIYQTTENHEKKNIFRYNHIQRIKGDRFKNHESIPDIRTHYKSNRTGLVSQILNRALLRGVITKT